jgi:hypothetical protein
MIYVVDNFLDIDFYNLYSRKLKEGSNTEVILGNKSFYVQPADDQFVNIVCDLLSGVEKKTVKPILAFFRCATDKLDNDWRIHSDFIIDGQKPDRACVLYMSKSPLQGLNGTALWVHHKYGKELPDDVTAEEFDRMILDESEDLTKWRLQSVIGNEPNRVISYPANYFHSKYPSTSWAEGRYVFVMFYKN